MDQQRREFFKRSLGVVATLSAAQLVASRTANAADLPHVDEADPQATGLGYRHDAAQVDKAKFPNFKDGSACASCALYQGTPDAEWGGCGIFAGKAVSAKGWCSAYAAKA